MSGDKGSQEMLRSLGRSSSVASKYIRKSQTDEAFTIFNFNYDDVDGTYTGAPDSALEIECQQPRSRTLPDKSHRPPA